VKTSRSRTSTRSTASRSPGCSQRTSSASGFLLNAIEPDSLENQIETVEEKIGPIEVVVYRSRKSVAGSIN
jgi:hypothetical protein